MTNQEKKEPIVTFSERLRALMETNGMSAAALARKTGLSHVAIGNYLNDRVPRSEHLHSIARVFGVSMEWLLTGEMIKAAVIADIVAPQPKAWGGPFYGTTDEAPLIARASAGELHRWEDMGHDVPRIKTSCRDPNCYAVQVDGDSMEPMYSEGDILVVAPNSEASPNDLVIAKTVDDDVLFKIWLGERKGKLRLQSFNPKYPMMEFEKGELRKIHPVHSVLRLLKEKISV